MANLIYYRNHFGGYQSSEEIIAAIDEIAADDLPQDEAYEEDELRDSDAYRIWADPTADERARVIARAWELAPAEQNELFWGCTTIQRPDAAPSGFIAEDANGIVRGVGSTAEEALADAREDNDNTYDEVEMDVWIDTLDVSPATAELMAEARKNGGVGKVLRSEVWDIIR